MATVKKKPTAKRAPAKKASVKKATDETIEKAVEEVVAESEPAIEAAVEQAVESVSLTQVEELIAAAVGKATESIIQAVTAQSPQTVPDAVMDEDMEFLELTDPIGAQLARQDGHTPGGKTVEAGPLETNSLTREQIESMTEAEIDAYNRNELAKQQKRKAQQARNRQELERMNTADRYRALTADRDPNRIRSVDNPLNERMIKCEALARVGLGDEGTSEVGETIMVPLSGCRHLQDQHRIKVLL